MAATRPRRRDFVKATTCVADSVAPGRLLTAEDGGRFCDIAMSTCGALRAGLFILAANSTGVSEPRQVASAEASQSGEGAGASDCLVGVTSELLQKAAARGAALTSRDLLVQPISLGQPDSDNSTPKPSAFLVLQAAPRARKGSLTVGSFTEAVDRHRARIIRLLASLKGEARSSFSESEAPTRLAAKSWLRKLQRTAS